MDVTQENSSFQVQFWGFIGPLVAMITLLVIFIKSPSQAIYLSAIMIFGLFASWKWKMQGFIFSFSSALLLYLYQFSEITPDEHLWHIGMNISIALSCVVAALSYKEVEHLLDALHAPPKAVSIEAEDISLKNEQIKSYESLLDHVKEEVVKANRSHEKLLGEFFEKQRSLNLAEEQLTDANKQIELLLEKQASVLKTEEELILKESKINSLITEINQLKQEISDAKAETQAKKYPENSQKEQLLQQQNDLKELKSLNELLSRERGRLETLLFRTQIDLHQKTADLENLPSLQAELDALRQEKQTLAQALETLENELNEEKKNKSISADTEEPDVTQEAVNFNEPVNKKEMQALIFNFKQIQGRYNQLREQFEEKSEVLDETRRQLFKEQELVLKLKLDYDEIAIYELNETVGAMEQHILKMIRDSEEKSKKLRQEIHLLQDIITHLLK